ncbi:MAG TPA: hypothetical protein VKA09_02250 [Nitrososphaeraceae archaeon]|nr:hypothetical protein [Nitrososphaeraceae archaeon]
MSGTTNGIREFLNYEWEKLKYIAQLESKRLDDLKDARATIFKYAIPTTVIDAVAGSLRTYFTGNTLLLIGLGPIQPPSQFDEDGRWNICCCFFVIDDSNSPNNPELITS